MRTTLLDSFEAECLRPNFLWQTTPRIVPSLKTCFKFSRDAMQAQCVCGLWTIRRICLETFEYELKDLLFITRA